MAYGFTADEEQKHEQIVKALNGALSDNYQVTFGSHHVAGWAVYPNVSTFKRSRIVKDMVDALQREGFQVSRTCETQTSKYVFAFIEVGSVAIEVGAARRGGLGVFASTIANMNKAISDTVKYLDAKKHDTQMKANIKAKLTAEEIAFLKL